MRRGQRVAEDAARARDVGDAARVETHGDAALMAVGRGPSQADKSLGLVAAHLRRVLCPTQAQVFTQTRG